MTDKDDKKEIAKISNVWQLIAFLFVMHTWKTIGVLVTITLCVTFLSLKIDWNKKQGLTDVAKPEIKVTEKLNKPKVAQTEIEVKAKK